MVKSPGLAAAALKLKDSPQQSVELAIDSDQVGRGLNGLVLHKHGSAVIQ